MLRIILCEDNLIHMKLNKEYIENTLNSQCLEYKIRTYNSTEDIRKEDIIWSNVAFLDIDLGEDKKTGIDFANQALIYNNLLAVVFLTSYQEYTSVAFKLQAFGYLEKPVMQNELYHLIKRLAKYIGTEVPTKFLKLYDNRNPAILKEKDIIYLERNRRKVNVITRNRQISVTESIKSLEERLGRDFLKINQGTIINKRYVSKLEGDIIFMETGQTLFVSRGRKKIVSEQLSI